MNLTLILEYSVIFRHIPVPSFSNSPGNATPIVTNNILWACPLLYPTACNLQHHVTPNPLLILLVIYLIDEAMIQHIMHTRLADFLQSAWCNTLSSDAVCSNLRLLVKY